MVTSGPRRIRGIVYLLLLACLGFMTICFNMNYIDIPHFKWFRSQPTAMPSATFLQRTWQAVEPQTPTDGTQTETTDTFMQRYADIHAKRGNYTRRMCALHRHDIPKMEKRPQMLVNEEHKMVYCKTPKAGTVSWCRIMLILSGYKNYTEVMRMNASSISAAWKRNVPHLSSFPADRQEHIMATYTKFMFVRHPFTRLLSAFNDKFANRNGSYKPSIQRLVNRIDKNFRWEAASENMNEVEFVDFINMVAANSGRNVHWTEMYRLCYPCDINYDVIGHFEDMGNDSKYILTLSNVTDLQFPVASGVHSTNSSSDEKIRKAFSSVPVPYLADLYQRYKYDFTLFGYDIPFNT